MSFFKKLLAFAHPFATDVAAAAAADRSTESLTPRSSRVKLLPLHEVSYSLITKLGIEKLDVANVSTSGIGLLRGPSDSWPVSGVLLDGRLTLGTQAFELKLRVVHVSQHIVGCQFEGASPQLQKQILDFFEVEISALATHRVESRLLKAESEGMPNWIYGRNNCELFFVENHDQIVHFHICFFGSYLEGGEGLRVRSGYIEEDEEREQRRYGASPVVRWDSDVSRELIGLAIKFLGNIPELSAQECGALVQVLTKP